MLSTPAPPTKRVCILHCGVTGCSDLASAFLWGWSLASFSIFSIWSFVCSLSSKCWGPSQHSLPSVPLTWASLSLGLSQPGPFTQAVESRTAQPLGLSFKPRPWSLSPAPGSFLTVTSRRCSVDMQCLFSWLWPALSFRTHEVRNHNCLN